MIDQGRYDIFKGLKEKEDSDIDDIVVDNIVQMFQHNINHEYSEEKNNLIVIYKSKEFSVVLTKNDTRRSDILKKIK